MENNSIFFQYVVLDIQDPLMLGRIRARSLSQTKYEAVLGAITDPPWDPLNDPWTERDPLIFNPLLPYFLYQTPKVDELIMVVYTNKDFIYQNQYYVQNSFYSPTSVFNQFNVGGNKFTGTGLQIKNPKNLKNRDGTYTDSAIHKGVFPEPGDNAFMGRGSADLIIKKDEVLLRTAKFKEIDLQPNVIPVNNPQRGFLQLSRFDNIKQTLPSKKYFELLENVIMTKYLIEWVITNPENEIVNQDGSITNLFTGSIYLYQLKPDPSVNSKNLTVNSKVDEKLKKLVATETFALLSKNEVIKKINDFIKTCNSSNVTVSGIKLFPTNNASDKFPIFYRPNPAMYSLIDMSTPMSQTSPIAVKNVSDIYRAVRLQPSSKGGFGLIYSKNKVGIPRVPKKILVPQSRYINRLNTVGALGSDKLYLLAHNAQIPGKTKINFDNSLYGIDVEKFAEIENQTSSMVRGEELLDFLNLIVRFLVSHTHAYPGLPPTPKTEEGTTTAQILSENAEAQRKILNSDIRLN